MAFRWNDALGRYIGADGRIVAGDTVRDWLDVTLANTNDDTDALYGLLQAGQISLGDFRNQMRQTIKDVHLSAIAAQKGGWAQMTQADFGRAGQRIREQYGYLELLIGEVSSGEQPVNGWLQRRLRLYAQAGRESYHLAERNEMLKRGFDQERSVLDPTAEHCEECEAEAAKGWQDIGDMTPIGQRKCNKNDRCRVEYRNSATGEVRR